MACSCALTQKVSQTDLSKESSKSSPSAVAEGSQKISLISQIPKINELISGLQGGSCAISLQELYNEIYVMDPARVDLAELAAHKEEVLPQFFSLRIRLREKLEQLRQAGTLTDECIVATRNIFRASRNLEEYAAEYIYKPGKFDKTLHNPLAGGLPNLLINPKFAGFTRDTGLKSGDLLMSRGEAFTSAMIARLGDVDAQFSHIAVLYIDPATQQKWVMESHIEIGNIVRPFSEYVKDLNFRIVVLRQPDAELAHRSAQSAFHLVKERYEKKNNIPYDFHMRLSDTNDLERLGDKEIFCSELARIAYREGSDGKFMVPWKFSTYHHSNKDILNRLGITAETSFAPGDMDVDPRFEVVAEWRDLTRVAQSRYFDAIFTKYFEWMEKEGYQLKDRNSLTASVLAPVIYKARQKAFWSHLLKLEKMFPLNMSLTTFQTIALLNGVREPIYNKVKNTDDAFYKKQNYRMTTGMIFELLETYRMKDLETYKQYKKWENEPHMHGGPSMAARPWPGDFHFLFGPSEEKLVL
jgi:hypothetical protein